MAAVLIAAAERGGVVEIEAATKAVEPSLGVEFAIAPMDCPSRRAMLPGCAMSEHRRNYSMTASARAISDGGTDSPIALAVLRLSTSSNLVGWRNGRSPGLAPLRMRPT